jgi:hypothetical protein
MVMSECGEAANKEHIVVSEEILGEIHKLSRIDREILLVIVQKSLEKGMPAQLTKEQMKELVELASYYEAHPEKLPR